MTRSAVRTNVSDLYVSTTEYHGSCHSDEWFGVIPTSSKITAVICGVTNHFNPGPGTAVISWNAAWLKLPPLSIGFATDAIFVEPGNPVRVIFPLRTQWKFHSVLRLSNCKDPHSNEVFFGSQVAERIYLYWCSVHLFLSGHTSELKESGIIWFRSDTKEADPGIERM